MRLRIGTLLPTPIDSEQPLQYEGLVSLIVDTVNTNYLPDGFKRLMFLKLIYVKKYINLAFEYRFQLALAQTNCSANSTSPTCKKQPHTLSLLVEALVTVVPWFGSRTVDSVEVKIHDCTQPIPLGKPPTQLTLWIKNRCFDFSFSGFTKVFQYLSNFSFSDFDQMYLN